MKLHVEARTRYVYAELRERESAADMRAFILAAKRACLEHGCPRVLLSIRDSSAVFKAEDYGLDGASRGYMAGLVTAACRIALVGDSSELHHAHEYIELVARQQGVNVRAFRDPAAAAQWLVSSDDLQSGGGGRAAGDDARLKRA
ncbi:MAG TPA: hypothetical protein VK043_14855 [Burkholderiales bacterium]|nr:hypothetical protein [Burkholderiales bacterium]